MLIIYLYSEFDIDIMGLDNWSTSENKKKVRYILLGTGFDIFEELNNWLICMLRFRFR